MSTTFCIPADGNSIRREGVASRVSPSVGALCSIVMRAFAMFVALFVLNIAFSETTFAQDNESRIPTYTDWMHASAEPPTVAGIRREMASGALSRKEGFLRIMEFAFGDSDTRADLRHQFGSGVMGDGFDVAFDTLPMLSEDQVESGYRTDIIRCFTPYIIEFGDLLDSDEFRLLSQMNKFLPAETTSEMQMYISPSGKFRLMYYVEGIHQVPLEDTNASGVPDYIELAGKYADSTWNYLVGTLGYRDPVPADTTYEIRFLSLSFYGLTRTVGGTTRIEVHNNFENFPPNLDPDGNALGALKATIAHEFMHAIQYETNHWQGNAGTISWVEIDATMVEEIVFPTVKDYLNYIRGTGSLFRSPQASVPNSYPHVTYGLYYFERMGPSFWVDVWDFIGQQFDEGSNVAMFEAIDYVLTDRGYDFTEEFIQNMLWHYAAGNRSRSEFGFQSRELYPDRMLTSMPGPSLPGYSHDISLSRYSTRFLEFAPNFTANGRVTVSLLRNAPAIRVGLIAFFPDGSSEMQLVSDDEVSDFDGYITPWYWSDIEKIGIVLVNPFSYTARGQLLVTSDEPDRRFVYGDSNMDGVLNTADAENLLMRIVSSIGSGLGPQSTPLQLKIADVSGNSTVSPYDASFIYRKASGLIDQFPTDTGGDGVFPETSMLRSAEDGSLAKAILSGTESVSGKSANLIGDSSTSSTTKSRASSAGSTNSKIIQSDWYTGTAVDDDSLRVTLSLSIPESYYSAYIEVLYDSTLIDLARIYVPNAGGVGQISRSFATNNGSRIAIAAKDAILGGTFAELVFVPAEDTVVTVTIPMVQLDEHVTRTDVDPITAPVRPKEGVGTEPIVGIPTGIRLHPAYPNPFNPTTTIRYELSETRHVYLDVLDVTGRIVGRLQQGVQPAGEYQYHFGSDRLASGIYIIRLRADDPGGGGPAVHTQKITLIK